MITRRWWVSGAFGLAVETLPNYLPFKEQIKVFVDNLPIQLSFQLPFLPQQTPESLTIIRPPGHACLCAPGGHMQHSVTNSCMPMQNSLSMQNQQ